MNLEHLQYFSQTFSAVSDRPRVFLVKQSCETKFFGGGGTGTNLNRSNHEIKVHNVIKSILKNMDYDQGSPSKRTTICSYLPLRALSL